MKIIFKALLITLFISFSVQSFEQEEPKVETYRTLSQNFMGSLKTVLQKEIKQNGIVSAVKVCSDTAQVLSNKFGTENGIKIKRVSNKNRNPLNIPDDYESSAIAKLEEMKKSGNLNKETEFFEVVNSNGSSSVRYIKPILTEGVCLSCHGGEKNISEEVLTAINKEYPNDKATNYSVGDLRGIISITHKVK